MPVHAPVLVYVTCRRILHSVLMRMLVLVCSPCDSVQVMSVIMHLVDVLFMSEIWWCAGGSYVLYWCPGYDLYCCAGCVRAGWVAGADELEYTPRGLYMCMCINARVIFAWHVSVWSSSNFNMCLYSCIYYCPYSCIYWYIYWYCHYRFIYIFSSSRGMTRGACSRTRRLLPAHFHLSLLIFHLTKITYIVCGVCVCACMCA